MNSWRQKIDILVAVVATTLGVIFYLESEKPRWFTSVKQQDHRDSVKVGDLSREAGLIRFREEAYGVWRDLESDGLAVKSGDAIYTSSRGRAKLTLIPGKVILKMDPDSLLVVRAPPRSLSREVVPPRLEVKKGRVQISLPREMVVPLEVEIGKRLYEFLPQRGAREEGSLLGDSPESEALVAEARSSEVELMVNPKAESDPVSIVAQEHSLPVQVSSREQERAPASVSAKPMVLAPSQDLIQRILQPAEPRQPLAGGTRIEDLMDQEPGLASGSEVVTLKSGEVLTSVEVHFASSRTLAADPVLVSAEKLRQPASMEVQPVVRAAEKLESAPELRALAVKPLAASPSDPLPVSVLEQPLPQEGHGRAWRWQLGLDFFTGLMSMTDRGTGAKAQLVQGVSPGLNLGLQKEFSKDWKTVLRLRGRYSRLDQFPSVARLTETSGFSGEALWGVSKQIRPGMHWGLALGYAWMLSPDPLSATRMGLETARAPVFRSDFSKELGLWLGRRLGVS
ncbi:MAG: hypothetical protein RJB38_957, partial [Pseudomonadota bacterium]